MYIERFLEHEINRYLSKKEIIAIVGPRQSGKTTLMKHIFKKLKNAKFIDFSDREILELFSEDIQAFIEIYVKNRKYLFIDEFQYAVDGGKQLKYIYDNFRTKIFISGSSVSSLSIHGLKHLVGRVFVFNLYPLSFEEYLKYKEYDLYKLYLKKNLSRPIINRIIHYFNEFCIFGGYPRVVLSEDNEEKKIVLKNIYNTYLLKEVREILGIQNDYKLIKLIKALALQIGNIINYNELTEISGFNYKELIRYINILEKTFVTMKAQPFYTNKRTELVKSPKIFFLDNGFRNNIIKNFLPVEHRNDKGNLYENFVASEILKNGFDLKYWRTKSKAEVDFVIEKEGNVIPIEVKAGLKKPKLTKSFRSFIEKYRPNKGLFFSERIFEHKNGVTYRPVFSISREIK